MKKAWIDVETGGLNAETDAMLQIAVVVGKQSFVRYIRPPKELNIEQEALDINGITQEMIAQADTERVVFKELKIWLKQFVDPYNKNDKLTFHGYNTQFDTQFVQAMWERNNDKFYGSFFSYYDVDTFALVKRVWDIGSIEPYLIKDAEAGVKPNLKLNSMCEMHGVELSNAHDALADIEATKKLDKILVKLYMKKIR